MRLQIFAPDTSMNAVTSRVSRGVISLPRHTCRRKPEILVVNRSFASVSKTLSVTAKIQRFSRVHHPWECVKICCFLVKYLKCFGVAWCLFSGHVHFSYSPVFRNQNYIDLHRQRVHWPAGQMTAGFKPRRIWDPNFCDHFGSFFSSKNKIEAFFIKNR